MLSLNIDIFYTIVENTSKAIFYSIFRTGCCIAAFIYSIVLFVILSIYRLLFVEQNA